MTSFDTIIIGAGHNGLVAASTLAAQGRRVVVVEAAAKPGGAAATVEFAPGYRTSGLAHIVNRLAPEVISSLKLDKTRFEGASAPTVVLDRNRGPVVLRGGYGEVVEGVGADEAKAFADMRRKLLRQADILKRFLARRPPRPGDVGFSDMANLGMAGLSLLRGGRDEARDFARMLLMNVSDIVDEYLSDDRLKGLVSFDATLGIQLGPRSPTSLLGLFYRLTGEAAGLAGGQYLPKGGMGTVADALVGAAQKAGVTLRLSSPVKRILTDRGKVSGVELEGGETLEAAVVASAVHPALTLRGLVSPGEVDTELSRALKHMRSNGNVAKLHLALDRVPEFAGVSREDLKGRLVIARSVRHVEEAFNPAKYGEFSPDPVMEITLPSLSDPSLAPSGGCTLSALAQYAPYDLKGGWESGRPQFLEAILDAIETYAPGLRASITASELLVPPDIEARYRMPAGHWHHGELQADQMLLNRPAFAVSGYDTPIEGLYLCSAGSHPGGGISGLPGLNCARHIIARNRS
ncbi:NAD(P)/FAD-dependent oxidoreductase [Rhizobiaceae bacterium n13]|uniref:Pyridine nucleotide-disulfide oxidoreductase domain-containing protein 2 n=1 Tax=Ferirhizobium litorale TaxID=2927786 RepID=A0AAE3U2Z0_9HYPH|nr:NAD(P)/FAD-dependent oxidoreductase [Fererhizobium litorale]MDI7863150.1 NAD(P)/FAD-dependent oxidoreductase [Fererhizobium litorale]MDI7923172.1 NAD(P)/FAD-dependent oxidoreductase [Fererhizobium litorale]